VASGYQRPAPRNPNAAAARRPHRPACGARCPRPALPRLSPAARAQLCNQRAILTSAEAAPRALDARLGRINALNRHFTSQPATSRASPAAGGTVTGGAAGDTCLGPAQRHSGRRHHARHTRYGWPRTRRDRRRQQAQTSSPRRLPEPSGCVTRPPRPPPLRPEAGAAKTLAPPGAPSAPPTTRPPAGGKPAARGQRWSRRRRRRRAPGRRLGGGT
jgi:hypothetical protein